MATDYSTGIVVGAAIAVIAVAIILSSNRSKTDKVKDAGRDLKSAAKDIVR